MVIPDWRSGARSSREDLKASADPGMTARIT
jgi:hypothetical protein